jgi:rapamycin-insensitive companion of mTOR
MILINEYSIKAKHPEQFRQVELFQKTLTILESHHFRLPARRFALDLFDKSVMRRVVLEEDEDSYSESDS